MDRNIYRVHLGTDTLTNLGPMSWQFVPDKMKIIQRYESSNLGLKLEPLTTAHVGSTKRFLRILVFKVLGFVEVAQTSNGIRTNYL